MLAVIAEKTGVDYFELAVMPAHIESAKRYRGKNSDDASDDSIDDWEEMARPPSPSNQ